MRWRKGIKLIIRRKFIGEQKRKYIAQEGEKQMGGRIQEEKENSHVNEKTVGE